MSLAATDKHAIYRTDTPPGRRARGPLPDSRLRRPGTAEVVNQRFVRSGSRDQAQTIDKREVNRGAAQSVAEFGTAIRRAAREDEWKRHEHGPSLARSWANRPRIKAASCVRAHFREMAKKTPA
jgi:hypothetical protein